jgi:hypothetical protein
LPLCRSAVHVSSGRFRGGGSFAVTLPPAAPDSPRSGRPRRLRRGRGPPSAGNRQNDEGGGAAWTLPCTPGFHRSPQNLPDDTTFPANRTGEG